MPQHPARKPIRELTQKDVLVRWPRLVAHMICESLGYFTPKSAANAILCYLANEPFWCEWYMHIANIRAGERFGDKEIAQVGRDMVKWAIQRRHVHKGFMSEYQLARRLVEQELQDAGPVFASWL